MIKQTERTRILSVNYPNNSHVIYEPWNERNVVNQFGFISDEISTELEITLYLFCIVEKYKTKIVSVVPGDKDGKSVTRF